MQGIHLKQFSLRLLLTCLVLQASPSLSAMEKEEEQNVAPVLISSAISNVLKGEAPNPDIRSKQCRKSLSKTNNEYYSLLENSYKDLQVEKASEQVRVENLEFEKAMLQREKALLQEKLDNTQQKVQQSEAIAKQNLADFQSLRDTQQADYLRIQCLYEGSTKEVTELKGKLASAVKQQQDLNECNDKLKTIVEDNQAALKLSEETKARFQAQISIHENEKNKLIKQTAEDNQAALKLSEETKARFQAQISIHENEKNKLIKQTAEDNQAALKLSEETKARFQAQISIHENEKNKLIKQAQEQESKYTALTKEYNKQKEQTDKTYKEFEENAIKLQDALTKQKTQYLDIENLNKLLNIKETKLKAEQGFALDKQKDYELLKKQNIEQESLIQTIQQQIQQFERKKRHLKTKITSLEADKQTLTKNKGEIETKYKSLKFSYNNLEREKREAQKSSNTLYGQLKNLQAELERYKPYKWHTINVRGYLGDISDADFSSCPWLLAQPNKDVLNKLGGGEGNPNRVIVPTEIKL